MTTNSCINSKIIVHAEIEPFFSVYLFGPYAAKNS